MIDKTILEGLRKTGLGKNEIEVYLGLLELGESKAGSLSKRANISTSHLYPVLHSLIAKGLVSYKYANNVKIYYPNPPETLKALYLQKKKDLDEQKILLLESIDKIKKIPAKKETFSNYKYYEGISGIIAMWQEIIAGLIPNTEIQLLSSNEESLDPFNNIFMQFQAERIKKNISQKLIFPRSMGKKYSLERKKLGSIEIRYTSLEPNAELCLFHDYMAIEYLDTKKDKPRAFLIKDKLFVDYFKMIFNFLWEKEK